MKSLYESILKSTKAGKEEYIKKKIEEIRKYFEDLMFNASVYYQKTWKGFYVVISSSKLITDMYFVKQDKITEKVFPEYLNKIINKNCQDIGYTFNENTISDFEFFPKNCKYIKFFDTKIKSFDHITECFAESKECSGWNCGIFFERYKPNSSVKYSLKNIDFQGIDVNFNFGLVDYSKDIKGCKFNKLYIRYDVSEGIELLKNRNVNSNPFASCAKNINTVYERDIHYELIANGLPGLCELIKNNQITELTIIGKHEKYLDGRLDCIERIKLDQDKQQKLLGFYK